MSIEMNKGNALKQALERRQAGSLPSNFSHRMMKRVYLEASKQKKRRALAGMIALISAVLALIGLGVYFLVFYLGFNLADHMPRVNVNKDASLFYFYVPIAVLALVLLGIDYWLHKKYIWK